MTFIVRPKEADLTKSGGIEYDIRASGRDKSDGRGVQKVGSVLNHAEHRASAINMKMED